MLWFNTGFTSSDLFEVILVQFALAIVHYSRLGGGGGRDLSYYNDFCFGLLPVIFVHYFLI